VAAGDRTQGVRRRDGTLPHDLAPGEYALGNGGNRLWLCSPDGRPGTVDSNWTITVHDDGSISVDPSIWWDKPAGWHGYLERGVWREV